MGDEVDFSPINRATELVRPSLNRATELVRPSLNRVTDYNPLLTE